MPDLARWAKPKLVVSCQTTPTSERQSVKMYEKAGAKFLGTWPHGAVTVRSSADGLRSLHNIAAVDYRYLPLLAQWIGWELTADDEVDRQRNEIVEGKVTHLFRFEDKSVGELVLADGTRVVTTPDHPFYSATRKAWVYAAELEPGELVAKRDFAALKRVCGVDDEDLVDMIAEIRQLNPKPGHAFGSTTVQPIVPDVFVRAGPDGGWIVELNSDTLPKVLINQSYYTKVSKTTKSQTDKAYLAECLQTATWLTRALDQRARTILKVATEIVRQQDGFFAHGVRHLRPLNLRTVADAIAMHESTVSRATSHKYMATPRGVVAFKRFFSRQLATTSGGSSPAGAAARTLRASERP